jgi:hypothetical protein
VNGPIWGGGGGGFRQGAALLSPSLCTAPACARRPIPGQWPHQAGPWRRYLTRWPGSRGWMAWLRRVGVAVFLFFTPVRFRRRNRKKKRGAPASPSRSGARAGVGGSRPPTPTDGPGAARTASLADSPHAWHGGVEAPRAGRAGGRSQLAAREARSAAARPPPCPRGHPPRPLAFAPRPLSLSHQPSPSLFFLSLFSFPFP